MQVRQKSKQHTLSDPINI
ncbi:hypothetical protein AYI69_g5647, partial [Smittium culicis]